jgi:hypothetical protein
MAALQFSLDALLCENKGDLIRFDQSEALHATVIFWTSIEQ